MHVKRRTLKVGGGLLETMFSGRWDQNLSRDSDGNVFLDHRPEVFAILISFLRDKAHEIPSLPPVRPPANLEISLKAAFYQLLEYYGLTSFVYQTCICSRYACLSGYSPDGGPQCNNGKPMTLFPGMQISFDKWYQGYFVQTHGNFRRLKTFEIIVGNCTRLEVGWASLSGAFQGDVLYLDDRVALCVERSSSKLVRRNNMQRKNQPLHEEDLVVFPPGTGFSKGTEIRFEEQGRRLYVDGELCEVSVSRSHGGSFPYLGLEGDIVLSAIEFY